MLPLLLLFGGHSCYHYSQQVPFLTNYKTISQKEPYVLVLRSRPKNKRWTRGGIEQISNWFLSNFSNYFSPSNHLNRKFSNQIEQISNESSIWKIWLHPVVGVESNRTNFESIFIEFFRIFFAFFNQLNRKFSNRTNFERIPIWLHP